MEGSSSSPRDRARRIVDYWNRRGWLRGSAPLHVHPLDLAKLEELIAAELARADDQVADTV